jgi:hypothetical protein
MKARPDKEALAARLDLADDPAAADPADGLDDDSRRVFDEMKAIRAVLRAGGPTTAPDGIEAKVMRRVAQDKARARELERARRHERRVLWAQAASLAGLVLSYGLLLAATRVHDVGDRWRPDASPSDDQAFVLPAAGPEREAGGWTDGLRLAAAPAATLAARLSVASRLVVPRPGHDAPDAVAVREESCPAGGAALRATRPLPNDPKA